LRVIDALRAEAVISRAEIARRTGLSRSTVSQLVSDLQADGLVVERAGAAVVYNEHGGRPPILLSFEPSSGAAVGIDFGHSHVRVAVSDLASNLLAERRLGLDTDHDAEDGLDAAAQLVTQTLAEAGVDRARVVGAGVGLPGPIEQPAGVVGSAAILPGWVGVSAAQEMRRRLELPIAVDNDANLGALAEAAFGAARNTRDLVYIKVSSGIGAGLILNGRLYRGSAGLAGELGHRIVDPAGPVCRCGNRGCLETVASAGALVARLRPVHGDDLTVDGMLALARAGDEPARAVIAEAGRAIGRAVADLLNVLNPELVVVGGELADAGELLLDGVRDAIAGCALPPAAEHARLVTGVLGLRAPVLGAVALVVSGADRPLLAAGAEAAA
jgi:predicted NBD/HSP70 family sugar kinase